MTSSFQGKRIKEWRAWCKQQRWEDMRLQMKTYSTENKKKKKQLLQKRRGGGRRVSSEQISSGCQQMLSSSVVCVYAWCMSGGNVGSFLVWMSAAALQYKPTLSRGDWCEPVLCPARAPWFLAWLQTESNQSAVRTWPIVKHGKASFVSTQINHKGLTFSGVKSTWCALTSEPTAVTNISSSRMYKWIQFFSRAAPYEWYNSQCYI